uniref:Endonuclease/exonuclease/phosphatase domain-containing protein n=1 Tax=Chromera velia CCMP2878 TaxID=1169474 RepID=A0A0G4H9D1_9ALVE|eukprot:Cvel_25404.t1-p1 / transcript=Cvel_25404.t1 / gene=Cvel_25404 / organism=Chromera_velia_CCMP2878 / gene_product=hypothetical protein / transcript_product=hypothetical protein / location=Cvel_scaffold2874:2179-3450(-) / protein_length=424 / sequence_SO=supercontig / SO=protein_coding / is_pseudo=false
MFTIVGAYIPTSSAQRYVGISSDALWDGIQGVLISSQADFRVLCGDFNAYTANLYTKVPLPSLSDNAPMPHASDYIALAGKEQRLGPSLYIQIQRDSRDRRRPNLQGRTLIDRASECELTILNGARLIPAVQPPLPSCLPPNPPAIDGAPISGQSCEHPSVTQRSPEESREDPLLGSALWDPCPLSAEHTYFQEAGVSVVDYMFVSTNLLLFLHSFSIRRDREIAPDHTLLCAEFRQAQVARHNECPVAEPGRPGPPQGSDEYGLTHAQPVHSMSNESHLPPGPPPTLPEGWEFASCFRGSWPRPGAYCPVPTFNLPGFVDASNKLYSYLNIRKSPWMGLGMGGRPDLQVGAVQPPPLPSGMEQGDTIDSIFLGWFQAVCGKAGGRPPLVAPCPPPLNSESPSPPPRSVAPPNDGQRGVFIGVT